MLVCTFVGKDGREGRTAWHLQHAGSGKVFTVPIREPQTKTALAIRGGQTGWEWPGSGFLMLELAASCREEPILEQQRRAASWLHSKAGSRLAL